MKIWKIVTVLLAVLLLAGCVNGADITISVTTPETGDKPGTPTTTTSGITLGMATWSPIVSDTFDAGTPYKITVEAKKSTEFAQGTTATINGKTAAVTLTNSNKTAVISYTFPATDAADLMSSITVTGITAPVTAAYPDTTASVTTDEGSSSAVIEKITWSLKDSSYFLLDKDYTVTVVVKPSSKDYAWDSSLTASIDGKSLTSSQITKKDGKVTLTYTYPKTTLLGKPSLINLEVNAPVVGNSQSSKVTSKTAGVMGTASWSPSGKFQPDTSYTTTITVETTYGYQFDSSVSATVNGVTAYIQKISDTKAIVSHTFAQIASVDSVNVAFEAPVTGDIAPIKAASVTSNPSGSANSATIKWTPALVEGEFDAGIEYMAEVTIPISGSNTVFDKETIVYINGEKAEIASVSSNSIKATYTFPKTLFIPNPIEIIKEMFNLMLAIFNPASYVFL